MPHRRTGVDAVHAWHGGRGGGVQADDARVRLRGEHQGSVQGAGRKLDVIHVLGCAADLQTKGMNGQDSGETQQGYGAHHAGRACPTFVYSLDCSSTKLR